MEPIIKNDSFLQLNQQQWTEKYQKLIQEFSKLKAQNSVLKKAIIDEQEKSNQLQEQSQEKNQELRRMNKEKENLLFHNHRLTKRLEAIQQDLKDQPRQTSWLLGVGMSRRELEKVQEEMKIIKQDLLLKIEENEKLSTEMFLKNQQLKEEGEKHDLEIEKYQKQIRTLREEVSKAGLANGHSTSQISPKDLEKTIEELKKENTKLQNQTREYELEKQKEEALKKQQPIIEKKEIGTDTEKSLPMPHQETQTDFPISIIDPLNPPDIYVQVNVPSDWINMNKEELKREELIKNYYEQQLSQLKNQIELLNGQIHHLNSTKKEVETDLKQAIQHVQNIEEEIQHVQPVEAERKHQ